MRGVDGGPMMLPERCELAPRAGRSYRSVSPRAITELAPRRSRPGEEDVSKRPGSVHCLSAADLGGIWAVSSGTSSGGGQATARSQRKDWTLVPTHVTARGGAASRRRNGHHRSGHLTDLKAIPRAATRLELHLEQILEDRRAPVGRAAAACHENEIAVARRRPSTRRGRQ
jgi:hypothetical protein